MSDQAICGLSLFSLVWAGAAILATGGALLQIVGGVAVVGGGAGAVGADWTLPATTKINGSKMSFRAKNPV